MHPPRIGVAIPTLEGKIMQYFNLGLLCITSPACARNLARGTINNPGTLAESKSLGGVSADPRLWRDLPENAFTDAPETNPSTALRL